MSRNGNGRHASDAHVEPVGVTITSVTPVRDQNGEIGLIAGDLVDSLPDAFYHLTA